MPVEEAAPREVEDLVGDVLEQVVEALLQLLGRLVGRDDLLEVELDEPHMPLRFFGRIMSSSALPVDAHETRCRLPVTAIVKTMMNELSE